MGKKVSKKLIKMNREELKQSVLKGREKYNPKLPAYISRSFEVVELKECGNICYRMMPKENFNGTYIVYIYGGYMCKNIDAAHWDFVTGLALKTGAALFVPMYPLAPEHCCREVFEMLQVAYANITRTFDVKRVILMGDSSGAGLALSLAMQAWKEGMRKPDQLIMLSPALDTEFFDRELEQELFERSGHEQTAFYTEAAKDFINKYWVKDYAVKTEYTSPYYEDYTDICDDVVIFSGENDMLNDYARSFYNKAKAQGVNIRFFEFEGEYHNFMIYSGSAESKKAFGYLLDVILGDYKHSMADLYPIKLKADWSKKYPEIIDDKWAMKFIYDNQFDFSGVMPRLSEYRNLVMAADVAACESKVRRYIMEYPNCTIVHVGCRLESAFDGLDNGRIQWYSVDSHNMMSVRRSMYGERAREKTLGRSLMDFSWMDDIACKRDQGIMFVCGDAFSYMNKLQVRSLIQNIWARFPGAELVFTAETTGAMLWANLHRSSMHRKKKHMAVDDAHKLFNSWRTDYRVMEEEPVTKYLGKPGKLKWTTRIGIMYNKITYNHKVVHVKLGNESYVIKI
ncbi:MAG: alpha/beta hydrolase fold domain-containing protein [Wujia sp.]